MTHEIRIVSESPLRMPMSRMEPGQIGRIVFPNGGWGDFCLCFGPGCYVNMSNPARATVPYPPDETEVDIMPPGTVLSFTVGGESDEQ